MLSRDLRVALLGCAVLVLGCFFVAVGAAGVAWLTVQTLREWALTLGQRDEPQPVPTLALTPWSAFAAAAPEADPLDVLAETRVPRQDLVSLAMRYKGVQPHQVEVRCPPTAASYEVGARRVFTVSNQDDNTVFQVTAELQHKTDVVYMWVEISPRRVRLDRAKLRQAAEVFSNEIYPRTRAFFGEEESPGVDCDPRVHVLHARGLGSTVGGYFSSADAFPRAVRADSNEAQLFVMHAEPGYNGADPGSPVYLSTLAHEFQHMISSHRTHSLELWLEEGAAQFAERLNGFGDNISTPYDFAARPETQLNTWQEDTPGGNGAHYGAGYLFWSYLYDRFGEDFVRRFARMPERSTNALLQLLETMGFRNGDRPFTFADLFADWVVANYVGQRSDNDVDRRYHYRSIFVPPMAVRRDWSATDEPLQQRSALPQFGTHYYVLRSEQPLVVSFTGSTVVNLLPMAAADGFFWWSGRADESNPRLTRSVDLRGLTRATLRYRAWYRLERDYDYAFVSISTDEGNTWTTLDTPHCTRADPQHANLGCGYTGASGGAEPRWITETVDLTPFVGKRVWLRFEVVTDAGINREGFALDNITIPELGWQDDAEKPDPGWQAEGWVRLRNVLPQHWMVQAIGLRKDGAVSVDQLRFGEEARGTFTLDFTAVERYVLAISPVTRFTTEPAAYELRIMPATR
ncbi:MAG: immune inhibitor A [Anaerolineae bacterium]|nr:immune inhibitor A [Anaerolineae bacterium]